MDEFMKLFVLTGLFALLIGVIGFSLYVINEEFEIIDGIFDKIKPKVKLVKKGEDYYIEKIRWWRKDYHLCYCHLNQRSSTKKEAIQEYREFIRELDIEFGDYKPVVIPEDTPLYDKLEGN